MSINSLNDLMINLIWRLDIFERSRLIPKIVETFQDKIIQGELKEGERLPSQDKLAEIMGVSRGTLREGLNQLVLNGTLHIGLGEGRTFGSKISAKAHVDFVLDRPTLELDGKIIVSDRKLLLE